MPQSARITFLRSLGAIYVCAFVSFWLQYPGLLGERGLLPASMFWRQLVAGHHGEPVRVSFLRLPSLLWFVDEARLSEHFDETVLGVTILGTLLGSAAACGRVGAWVLGGAFVCYLTLYTVGQTWLGFQWDIFLLETGAAAALTYAPMTRENAAESAHPGAWVLRAITVKFMVMSGVVKVTSECPTWRQLTALEYHFASTCLPTAEAWYMHSLPPGLLRLGVAAMFVTELVAPWLLLAPIASVRRVGVAAQLPLQLAIQLTGNYNWFNLHTCAMMLPAWARDGTFIDARPYPWLSAAATAAVAVWTASLFSGSVALLSPDFELRTKIDPAWADVLMRSTITSSALAALYACLALTAVGFIARARSKLALLARLLVSAWCAVYLGIVLLPLRSIAGKNVRLLLPPLVSDAVSAVAPHLEPFHAAHSYGLFRRMTGVGQAPPNASRWGGLPPSVPAVPVVVIETSIDGTSWTELELRYAPGDPTRAPKRTAPHQPRLDWQFWFAALGTYRHNPWFLHLCYKLVAQEERDSPALDLLANKPTRANFVRAWLYHYDFTRIPSPWACNMLPAVSLVNCSSGASTSLAQPGFGANCLQHSVDCGTWWTRTKVSEYIPAVDSDLLRRQVIQPQGWPVSQTIHKRRPPIFSGLAALGAAVDAQFASLRTFQGFDTNRLSIDGPLLLILVAVSCPVVFLHLLHGALHHARALDCKDEKGYCRRDKRM